MMAGSDLEFDAMMRARKAAKLWNEQCAQPWVLGSSDCCSAVADVFECVSDIDLLKDFRGAYNSFSDLLQIMREEKCADFFELIEKKVLEAGLQEQDGPAQAYDLGFLIWSDDFGQNIKKLNGLPAFYQQGFWHARTHGGFLALRANDARLVSRWGLRVIEPEPKSQVRAA